MHLTEGQIYISLVGYLLALGVCSHALKQARKDLRELQVPLLGIGAVFILLLQLLTFALPGGLRGHFCGALLLSMLMGPWIACLIIAVVVLIQTLLLSQGSVISLGSNVLSLGFVAGVMGYSLLNMFKSLFPHTRRGFLFATAFASWSSLVLSVLTADVFLFFSGTVLAQAALLEKVVVIGFGEAAITTLIVALLLVARPDLVVAYCCGNEKDVCYEDHHHKHTHHH